MFLTYYGHGFEQVLDLLGTRGTPLPYAKVIMQGSHTFLESFLSSIRPSS